MSKKDKRIQSAPGGASGEDRPQLTALVDLCVEKILETEIGRPDLTAEIAGLKASGKILESVFESRFEGFDRDRKEALLRLILYMEERTLIPFLTTILNDRIEAISIKKSASNILVALGEARDIELFAELDKADRLQMRLERSLTVQPQEASTVQEDPATELSSLPEGLRRSILRTLLETHGAAGLPILPTLFGKDDVTDILIVDAISTFRDEASARQLRLLKRKTPSKKVAKAIKKALYTFKQQGTLEDREEETEETGGPVWKPPKKAMPEGFMSAVDPAGDMMIWVMNPVQPRGLVFMEGLVNDRKGLKLFSSFQVSRKSVREFKKEVMSETDLPIVETDSAFCTALFEEAYKRTELKQSEAAQNYSQARGLLSSLHRGSEPISPVYRQFEEGEFETIRKEVDQSTRLLEEGALPLWLPPEESLRPYFEAYQAAQSSKIVLNDYQKKERLDTVCRDAAGELFDGEERALMKRRLEIMGWIFWTEGKQKETRLALAAALSLEEGGLGSGDNPFLAAVIRTGFELATRHEEDQKKDDPSFIVRP